MKKVFTFLLLFTALLCSGTLKAEETVFTNSDFKIVKVSASEYRVEALITNANFNDLGGLQFADKSNFQNCTGKITIKGSFSSISGLKGLKYTDVDMSELSMTTLVYGEQTATGYTNYNPPIQVKGVTRGNDKLNNFFGSVKKIALPNDEEKVDLTYFQDMKNYVEEIYFGSDTKEIKDLQNSIFSDGKLKKVTFGNSLERIGKNAFYECYNLEFVSPAGQTNASGVVSFPESLKEIGGDAFYGCYKFKSVDLRLPYLWKVDYAAFNMKDDSKNQLTTVYLPGTAEKPNTTLTFFANQVFSSSRVAELDFSYCEGIKHFAYDGQNSMNEGTGGGSNSNGTATFYWHPELQTLKLPPYLEFVPGGADSNSGVAGNCPKLKTVIFTGHAEYDKSTCVEGGINKIDNPLIIDARAFSGLSKLDSVKLSNNVIEIRNNAFEKTALKTIRIPASVQTVGKEAFGLIPTLTTVIFEDIDAKCKPCKAAATHIVGDVNGTTNENGDPSTSSSGAFYTSQYIKDVYVYSSTPLVCDNYAFNYDITWAHGDAAGRFATLHFPEEFTENYVNLGHSLDDKIVSDQGLFHKWLWTHIKQAGNPYKNGWYEFINAGPIPSKNEPACEDIILRTFSDYDQAYLIPDGLRAYVVNDVSLVDGNYVATLQRLPVIPEKTGVILYGHPNSKDENGKPVLSLTPVHFAKKGDLMYNADGTAVMENGQQKRYDDDEGKPLRRMYWDDNFAKNYLEPIVTSNGSPMDLEPYEKEGNVVKFRNFAMGRYSSTDYNTDKFTPLTAEANNYVGFFRAKRGAYTSGYAYLRLAADELTAANCGEILVKQDGSDDNEEGAYYYEFDKKTGTMFNARTQTSKNPKGWWDPNHTPYAFTWKEYKHSWGDRTIQFSNTPAAEFLGELEEDADGIVKLVIPANSDNNGTYYTLQGVKVNHPTKGIYIQNGKKIIIK